MISFNERLKQPNVIIADGAMGTMLFQRGLKPGECPERMNLEHPEVLEEIARLYFEAGAEIIQTNTFGGSPLKLSVYGLENQTEEINSRAVQAVRKVVADKAYVSASCGPTGKLLEPFGDTKPIVIFESYLRQLKALICSGVDMICVETMTDLNEAILAVKAARSIAAKIPICATMTFDSTPRGFYTIMGVTIEQAVKGLTEAGADIIGSNCGNGIEKMIAIAKEFKTHTTLPIIIQSNAGLPVMKNGNLIYNETHEFMAEKSRELLSAGVKIIGGCCGTTPEHIAAMKKINEINISLIQTQMIQNKCSLLNSKIHRDKILGEFKNRQFAHEMAFASLDLIEDCQNALDEYKYLPDDMFRSRSTLYIYGVLQALFCQQNGARSFYESITAKKITIQDFF
jgi:5-methyltetrahydrofolate--homocysteine methyltransferase